VKQPPAIVAERLSKRYGVFEAVHEISFQIEQGEVVAQEREFLGREVAPLAQRRSHGQLRRPLDGGIAHLVGVPLPPEPGLETDAGETVASGGELGLK